MSSASLTLSILRGLAFIALSTASCAFSQTTQQPDNSQPPARKVPETVTITGQRLSDPEIIKTVIAQFVMQHAARDRKSGLLVRDAPTGICPITEGLPGEYNDFITARIVSVAKGAGSEVQQIGNCTANVEVLFADDAQSLVSTLSQKTDGIILGFHFTHEKGPLVHIYRPVQAWYVTGTRGDARTWNSAVDRSGETNGVHSRIRIDDAYGPSPNTGTGSRIKPRMSSQIVNVLIVADLKKVAGQEIGPIADYIAMLALSQASDLNGCNELPSILDIMSAGCSGRDKPTALTTSDMAYLNALYAADITTSGEMGRENVEKGMTKDLYAPEAGRQ